MKRLSTGFTLLELLVVLALMGLMATLAVVRLQTPLRAARIGDVTQRIGFTDGQVRSHSQKFAQRGRLVYDLDESLVYAESDGARGVRLYHYPIPDTLRLTQVRPQRGDVEKGKTTIEVTSEGHTPTYAVRLESAQRRAQWLLFSGTTGQLTILESDADVHEVFRLLDQ